MKCRRCGKKVSSDAEPNAGAEGFCKCNKRETNWHRTQGRDIAQMGDDTEDTTNGDS